MTGWYFRYKNSCNDSFIPSVQGFKRKEFRGKLAIAITANFKNHWSQEENEVEEIGGLARQYDQDFFKAMNEETGVDLENIVYYKDEVDKRTSRREGDIRINNIADAALYWRFESFFYTLPDRLFWRTSDNDNAPP